MNQNKFKERRLKMELSQVQLAEALGLHQRTIIRYERGHTKVPRRVELAINSLRLLPSRSTASKMRSIGKRSRKRVNALRRSQLDLNKTQILHVAPKSQMRSQENSYTLGFNISLTLWPFLINHLEGRAAKMTHAYSNTKIKSKPIGGINAG
jgi:DNA-binding XRE family transcriptional regulator